MRHRRNSAAGGRSRGSRCESGAPACRFRDSVRSGNDERARHDRAARDDRTARHDRTARDRAYTGVAGITLHGAHWRRDIAEGV